MIKARAYLLEHGPQTAARISEAIGVPQGRFVQAVYASDELRIVGIDSQRYKQGAKRNLYGVASEGPVIVGFPDVVGPKVQAFTCSRLGREIRVVDCVEAYTDDTARYRSTPCAQCRTGAAHRARFAGPCDA